MDTRVSELDCMDFSWVNGLSCIVSENQLVSMLLRCRTEKVMRKTNIEPKVYMKLKVKING
jgi:hypothetical protein